MGQKNNALIEYLEDPRRFADIFNAFFDEGRQHYDPNHLTDAKEKLDGSLSSNPKTLERSKEIERIRDIRKIYNNNQILQILCLEDQDYIDYTAAVRTLTMDALEYEAQIKALKLKHREKNDLITSDEKMSGISKKDKLMPILTLWWYHGSNPYDGPRTLKDSFNCNETDNIDFVSDYKLNILTTDDSFPAERFHTEFKNLYKTLSKKNDIIAMEKLFKEDKDLQNIDEDTLRVIAIATDRPQIWKNRNRTKNKEGGYNMCLAFDQLEERGIKKGIEQGKNEMMYSLVQDGDLTIDKAAQKLGVTIQSFEENMVKAGFRLPELV